MLKKLRFKFIVYTMSVFSLIVSVVIAGLYFFNYQHIDQRADSILNGTINRVKNYSFDKYNPIQKYDADDMPKLVWAFKITANNTIIGPAFQDASSTFVEDLKALAIAPTGYMTYRQTEFKYKVVNEEYAFVDVTDDKERLSELMFISIGIGVMALVVVLVSSMVLADWAMKPVEESWRKQKEFVSDASHELRTPLSVILANTELLLDKQNETIGENALQVHYIQDESKRMKDLVENLLFLAKGDQSQQLVHKLPIDLSKTIYELVLPMEVVAFEKNRLFNLQVSDGVLVMADLAMVKQLITIFIDNAMKYSYEKTTIDVRLHANGVLSVTNYGDVIPEDKLDHLFDRFYRVDASRNKVIDGYGLGLSIARSIAKVHHTKIMVTSDKTNGTQFSVDFSKSLIKE